MEPIFVDTPTHLLRGDEARKRIEETNDLRFAEDDNILSVDSERWHQAQEYERASWMDVNPHYTTDRNEAHANEFSNYANLTGHVKCILELGCGPFTNTRLILNHVTADEIYLLDPLVMTYLKHPNCPYADQKLKGIPVELIERSIEAYNPRRRKFDIVVMINTLPHCYDAQVVFEKVPKLVKKGGYLVWGEFPTMPEVALDDIYDVGHPLKIRPDRMEAFLSQFQEVYRKGWYFIGVKE
jgi:SAM-dependent methyltransferase